MPVEERLMLPGRWDLQLKHDTPKAIRDALVFFGHVVIFDDWLDPRRLTDADLKSKARYIGILRRLPTAFSLSGCGLVGWLGDEDGKGDIYETAVTLTANTFAQWVTALLPPGGAVVGGTTTAIAGTLTQSFYQVTPRFAYDWVMRHFTGEYRVNKDCTLDAGPASALFNITPKAIVQRAPGGRDIGLTGVPATDLDVNTDAEDYSSRVYYIAAGGTAAASGADATYKDLRGNTAKITRLINNAQTTAALAGAEAATEAAIWVKTRTQVTLTSEQYDIGLDVAVGDNIWAYDPQRGLVDTANQVHYRGEVLLPITLRVMAMSYPIEKGMGVFYRPKTVTNGGADYTDLTPHIEWEPPGVSFELGAAMRRLT